MKKAILMMVMAMLLLVGKTQASVSVIKNGSFEDDGEIYDITETAPADWNDVNVPTDKFAGWIGTWNTDGDYSLTLCVKDVATETGDMAMVSQQVYLTDALSEVSGIGFDIKLCSPLSFIPWDLQKRSALVLIDGIIVWDSNTLGPSEYGDGVYLDQWISDFNGIDKDANPHTLTLAMRINEDIGDPDVAYYAKWDFVKFDAHCEGTGYLRADLTGPDGWRDCYVDEFDLKLLAEKWLEENPAYRYDLFEDGDNIVDFRDFAVLAEVWTGDSYGQDDKLLSGDLNNDGVVNLLDFAIAAENYGNGQPDFEDISILAEQWLQKNWLYWPE